MHILYSMLINISLNEHETHNMNNLCILDNKCISTLATISNKHYCNRKLLSIYLFIFFIKNKCIKIIPKGGSGGDFIVQKNNTEIAKISQANSSLLNISLSI